METAPVVGKDLQAPVAPSLASNVAPKSVMFQIEDEA